MGTASRFDGILKDELNIHAAWLPITNTFRVGDYGLVSDGVLVKAGNIKDDYGVSFQVAPGKASKLNFTSKGTSLVRSANGAEVQIFPDNSVDAKLTVAFSSSNSFLLKANLGSVEMQDLANVARKLANALGWKRKYRVVSAVYSAQDCAVISSKSGESSIELSGKADALKQFDLGAVAAGIEASRKHDIGLDLVGERGVIGLALFKLPALWGDEPKVLADHDVKVETSFDRDWPRELPDDV
ncbi:MAG: hypothetical protein ACOY4R_12020 [Pseudomonadota bacterium]